MVVALGAPRAVSGLPRPPSAPGGRCLDLLWRCGVWGGVGGWTEDGWAGAGGGQADCRRACSRPSTALATSSPLLPDLPQLPEQGKQAEAMPRSRGTAPPARGAPGRAAACPGNVRRTPRPRRRIHPRVARRPSPARRHLRWSPSEQLEVTRVEGEHSLLVRAPRASLRGRASRQQRPPALLRTARGEPAGWPGDTVVSHRKVLRVPGEREGQVRAAWPRACWCAAHAGVGGVTLRLSHWPGPLPTRPRTPLTLAPKRGCLPRTPLSPRGGRTSGTAPE